MRGLFVDISSYNPTTIDWQTYKKWSESGDGTSRVAIKSSEGVGFIDPSFVAHRKGALEAGIDQILYYHFARPDLGNDATSEADWQCLTVGPVRDKDVLVLDYEIEQPQAVASWALSWLSRQQYNYKKVPALYSYENFIRARLQLSSLAQYPLWYANWQFTPDERPTCPAPWKSYAWVQYSDKATVPGMPGTVDTNISFVTGGNVVGVPKGWSDNGTMLTAPNGVQVVLGFRDAVLTSWESDNWPIGLEGPNMVLGKGTAQLFRKGGLAWTSELGIFQLTLGEWILLGMKRTT